MGNKNTQTKTDSTSAVSADPQAQAYYRQLLDRVQGVAATPYQGYTGELAAPLSAVQNQGIGQIQQNSNWGQPYFQQAAGLAGAAAQPISSADIQRYASPYTQSVVDATQAQFDRSNSIQQAQAKGNSIARGGLGGNRRGVEIGQIAQAQNTAQNQVIAGLYDKGYQQAVQTAVGQQGAQLQGAYGLSGIAGAGQTAGIAGGNALIGAGGLQQAYQQALDNANYGQYQQAQAYPYQQAQWAAGLGTALGSSLGSTTTGQTTTTPPTPNPWTQAAGLGLTAASLFLPSDERVKEDVEKIGETNDGQPLYRYRYKGSPTFHIGLLAQNVEKSHPDAVGVAAGGMKMVDYRKATDDSVERADGGGVGGVPWGGAQSWIPQVGVTGKAPQSSSAPSHQNTGSSSTDPSKLIEKAAGLAKAYRDSPGNPMDITASGLSFEPSAVGSVQPSAWTSGDAMFRGLYAAGGGVPGFANGGMPFDERFSGRGGVGNIPMFPEAEVSNLGDRFAPVKDAIAGGTFDPEGANYSTFDAAPGMMPKARPEGAPPRQPVVAQGGDEEGDGPAPRGVAPASAFAPEPDYKERYGGFGIKNDAPEPPGKNFLGIENLSGNAKNALLTAGLSMIWTRSPFFGVGAGEGGLAGVNAFNAGEAAQQKAQKEQAEARMQAQKIADDLSLRRSGQTETARHNRATENAPEKVPFGWKRAPDGSVSVDPNFVKGTGEIAKSKATSASMDEDTAEFLADRVAAGDTKALVGLGRGAQGAENLAKINGIVARKAKEGLPISDAARTILANAAQQQGLVAAERRLATVTANLSVYGRTAFNATDIAEELSDKVGRTQWQPINKVLNAYKTNTGDKDIVAFGASINTLVNEYARAIGGGHGTVADKEHAREMLSAVQTKEQFKSVVNVMRREILAEEKALPEARKHMQWTYNPRANEQHRSVSDRQSPSGAGVAAPAGAGIPPLDKREKGTVYTNSNGAKGRWTGSGWEAVP